MARLVGDIASRDLIKDLNIVLHSSLEIVINRFRNCFHISTDLVTVSMRNGNGPSAIVALDEAAIRISIVKPFAMQTGWT